MYCGTILSSPNKGLVLPRDRANNPGQSTVQRVSNVINTALELVKSGPSRTVHLTRQRLRGIKQISHQNTEIFRLRLRSLPQINQRVALHRELHNNPQFLGRLNSSPATLTRKPDGAQPWLKNQPNPRPVNPHPKPLRQAATLNTPKTPSAKKRTSRHSPRTTQHKPG